MSSRSWRGLTRTGHMAYLRPSGSPCSFLPVSGCFIHFSLIRRESLGRTPRCLLLSLHETGTGKPVDQERWHDVLLHAGVPGEHADEEAEKEDTTVPQIRSNKRI